MGRGSKTLVASLLVALLAAGLVACGGDGDSTSSTTAPERASGDGSAGSGSGKSASSGGGEDKAAGSAKGDGQSTGTSGDGSGDFVPRQHDDSGGGSEQFKVKGGDNSVQEFGEEGEPSEFEAAAAVLHNFLDARAAGDWDAACGYMSKETIESFEELGRQSKQIEDRSCGGVLEAVINPAAMQSLEEEAETADVGSLRIEDETAFLIYTGLDGAILAMPMANESGAWKVAGIAGTPLN